MADYKNLKASDGTGNAVLATITNNRAVSGTILEVTSVENWPNEFIVMTGTLDANGYIEAASATEMKAHLTGTDIEIDSFEPGYTDVGNTSGQVAIIKMTTSWADDITELARVSHNDDGTLKDNIVTSANLKDGVGELGGAWTAYTPTSTSVTLGTGSLQGWYTKIGKTIHGRIRLSLGSGGSISGTIVLGLPEVVAPELKTSQGYFIGTAKILDAGVAEYPLDIIVNGDQEVKFYADSTSASYAKSINVDSTVPVASGLGNGDVLLATFTYEAA